MTNTEYMRIQLEIILLASKVRGMDLPEFIRRISVAESAGPLLDPTLYRTTSITLSKIKVLAQAFQRVQEAHENLFVDAVKNRDHSYLIKEDET